jgi:hypothetical protein
MTTIATLAVKIIADAAAFIKTMDESSKKTQSWSSGVSKNLKSVGGDMTALGMKSTTYLTLPILAAGGAALKMASDFEETKNKVGVVFGEMTSSVMSWSSTSDTAMGMSQQKALNAVSTFGAMGDSAGLNAKDNLQWSESLVQLGADWSSFYNLNPVDALNSIQSAVAGQYEPLRRMGIVIDDTSLKQKAMQMGLIEEGGTLSDSARYQALYALMVEKSSAAQGDFERTADGVANQARIVQAQFENAAVTLGQQLLPYATQLLQWVSQAITWFQALTPEQEKWVVVILAVVAAIGPLLIVVGSLVTAIGAIVGVVGAITAPMLIVVAVIAALIAIGYLLYVAWTNNWGGIQQKTAEVMTFVQSIIAVGMQFISDFMNGNLGTLSIMWSNTFGFIQTFVQNFITFWKTIFAAWAAAANGDWYTFGEKMREAFDLMLKTVGSLIETGWTNIKTAVSALVRNVVEFFKTTDWGQVGHNIVQGIANGLAAGATLIATAAKNAASAALDAAKGFLGIHSPSSVFEMQVGWQMAAGAALGWENGIDKLLSPTMPGLSPAAVGGTPGLGAVGGGGSRTVVVPVTYEDHSLINVNSEYEAKRRLRDIVDSINRDNENK